VAGSGRSTRPEKDCIFRLLRRGLGPAPITESSLSRVFTDSGGFRRGSTCSRQNFSMEAQEDPREGHSLSGRKRKLRTKEVAFRT